MWKAFEPWAGRAHLLGAILGGEFGDGVEILGGEFGARKFRLGGDG
jgi:hypothetical protein